jgi:hypothetical protein
MEASEGPWARSRPYIVGTQRCNGRWSLEVFLEHITVTQRSGALNGSIANDSFRPNGYLAVTASSVRESAFAGLLAELSADVDSLYPTLSPLISEISLRIQGCQRPTVDLL